MFLKSISLKNFKRFDELSIRFPDDITVVTGPNEKGKSSLVSAIVAGLFYDPKKRNREIEALRSWQKPDRLYEITMELEASGDPYVLAKDFERKKLRLENLITGETQEEFKEVTRKLMELGGYRNAQLFESTSCVKQDQIAAIAAEKKELSRALEDLIGGGFGSRGFTEIIQRMEKAVGEMNRGRGESGWRAKNPGAIKALEDTIRRNEEAYAAAEAAFKNLDQAWIRFWRIEGELEKAAQDWELAKKQLENIKTYFETDKEIKALRKDVENLSRDLQEVQLCREKMRELDRYLEKLAPYQDVDYHEFLNIFHSIKIREKRLLELKDERREAAGREGKEIIQPAALYALFGLTLAGALGFWFSPWFFIAWIAEGALLFWVAFSRRAVKKITEKELERHILVLGEELKNTKADLAKKFEALNIESLEELEEAKQYFRQMENEKRLLESKTEGILRDKSPDELKARERELSGRLLVEEAKLKTVSLTGEPSPTDALVLEKSLEKHAKAKEELQKQVAEVKAIIAHTKVSEEDLFNLTAEREAMEKKLKKLLEKEKIYRLTAEMLLKAKQETEKNSRGILERYMQEFLREITDGRYEKISITDDWLLKVLSPEKGEEILPDGHLSRGTIDQFYLVARFAFLKLLFPNTRPLIILDDPFQSFDKKRRQKTRSILKELAHEFQIILFTHSNDYDDWGTIKRLP